MRLTVFTTDTLHHRYFVRQLAAAGHDVSTVLETVGLRAPFPTAHAFEAERDSIERHRWFADGMFDFHEAGEVTSFESMNSAEAVAHVAADRPELTIVFGTGRLKPPVINACGHPLLNLHGGDPEQYRGLDSHMWAIYHRDFANLITTLHTVNAQLDDGDIVLMGSVPVTAGMPLAALRASNSELCVDLALGAVSAYAATGRVPARPQRQAGRYYSFMPAPLKDLCVKYFTRYVRGLA